MSTVKNTFFLFLLRAIKALIIVVSLALSANYFGVTKQRDIWILAYTCMVTIDLALWGPLNETFRAKFIYIKETEGEEEAIRGGSSLFILTTLLTLVCFILIISYPQIPSKILAPSYNEKDLQSLEYMIQLLAPSLLFNQIILLSTSILNAYNILFIPEYAGFITSIANILFLYIFAPYIGIYSLVISYYFSLFILISMLFWQIHTENIPLFKHIGLFEYKKIKPYILFAIPFYLPYLGGQINTIIEKSIGSLLGEGIVSIVDYSRKFVDIPSNTLISVLSTILIPILSSLFANNKIEDFKKEFTNVFNSGLLIIGCLIAYLVLVGKDLINFLYNHGSISTNDLQHITWLSVCYSISSLTIFCYSIMGSALIAQQQGKIYAKWGVFAQILMITINLLFFKSLKVYIYPLSLFLAHMIAAYMMIREMHIKDVLNYKITSKYVYLCIVLIAVSYGIKIINSHYIETILALTIFLKTLALVIIFIVLMMLFKLPEYKLISLRVEQIRDRYYKR